MRIEKPLPGYWYCDIGITPGLRVAVQEGTKKVLGLPDAPEQLIWVVMSQDGTKVAGTGITSGHAYEWDGKWEDRGPTEAPRAVIYQGDSLVTVKKGKTWGEGSSWTGSQGYRYVADSGILVKAMDSRNPSDSIGVLNHVEALYEYVVRGDIIVGQGANGGVTALVGGKRKRVESIFGLAPSTECYNVHFYRVGDALAISFYSLPYAARFVWLSMGELLDLPDDATSVPTPPSNPPTKPPQEKPPVPNYQGNPIEALTALRSTFPTPLGSRHAEFLVRAAQTIGHGAGLMKKSGGTVVTLPDGSTVSQDWIVFPDNFGIDFLSDGEGAAKVSWGALVQTNPGQYKDISGFTYGNTPPPTVPPPHPGPAGLTIADVEKAISAALAPIEEELNVFSSVKEEVAKLAQKLQDLKVPTETTTSFYHKHGLK